MLKIINFAHGAWLTDRRPTAPWSPAGLGLNPWLAIPFAFLVGAVLGGVAERFIVRPLYRRPLDAILATWGLGIVIGQLDHALLRPRRAVHPERCCSGTFDFWAGYSVYRLLPLSRRSVVGLAFALLLDGTRLGLSARAVIMNETLARGLGIDTAKVRLATFMIGTGLAALAGVLLDAADQRRSQYGRRLADRRLHAGDGRRLFLSRACRRLPRLRRRSGACQHLFQSQFSAASPSPSSAPSHCASRPKGFARA